MKRQLLLSLVLIALFVPFLSPAQAAGGGGGGGVVCALPTCQTVTLSPGWNIISTPKILASHSFSTAETSANFDIYTLDPSKASGWATLSDLGQTEFTPLWSYFVNNKTGSDQTLSFLYKTDTTPSDRLFSRTFSTSGWYSIGVANPTYALPVGTSATADTNNPSNILSGLSGFSSFIDLTHGWFPTSPDKVAVSDTWGSATQADINTLHDFRETKGYALYINSTGGLYAGFQNSATSTPAPVVDPNSITIAAGAQPTNSLAPAGAYRLPFTTIILTNNNPSSSVTVNGITVQRAGLTTDSVFNGVTLLDSNGLQLGATKTLDSNHQAVVGGSFTLSANQSITFTVVGNISNNLVNHAGELVSLQVVGVSSGATVAGSLPIVGATHTINTTLTLGSVATSTSTFDPGANQTKTIGNTAIKFSGIKFTAGSAESLKLYAIRFKQYGNIAAADLSNVVINVGGTNYSASVDTTGKYYAASFAGGILIPSNSSIDVYIQGDLSGSGAANHTVSFGIESPSDLYFVGQTYGYGIAPIGTWTNPWFAGYTTSVTAGGLTGIENAASVPAQNVAVNVSNQVLGGFTTTVTGENIQVHSMSFNIATSSTGAGLLNSITLVDENGAVVAGPVDATYNASSGKQKITFNDVVTFQIGAHTYKVKGKLPSNYVNSGTIILSTNPSADWTGVIGQISGSSIVLSQSLFNMNTMTVKTGSLNINMSSTPVAQNIAAGIGGFTFANILLDASASGEDMRVASLPVSFTGTVADLSGCQLFDGSSALTTGSRVINTLTSAAANTFTLDNTLVITKGTVKTLAIKCNVSGAAANGHTYQFGVNNVYSYSSTGVASGVTITPIITNSTGNTMTVATGTFTVAVDASTPTYSIAAGGTSAVTMGVIKLRATNEDVQLNKLGLKLTSGSASDITQAYIYNGATLVGTATFVGSNTTATSTLSTPVTLLNNVDKFLTIKADLSDIGSGKPGTPGALIQIDPLNAQGSGVSSGSVFNVGATLNVAGVRLQNSYPTVSLDTLPSTGMADGRLMHFRITANSSDAVGVYRVTFRTGVTAGISVSGMQLAAYTDSAYSVPVSGPAGVISTNANVLADTGNSTDGDFKFVISPNGIQIPAGTTRYFELRGAVSGVTSGSAMSFNLMGDSSATPLLSADDTANLSGTNFIWSPDSMSVSTAATTDWTNGYGVPGLSSSGITQNRTN